MFKIEKNIPVPSSRGRVAIYPFREMEVGDSFAVPGMKQPVLSNLACQAAKRIGDGRRYSTRRQPDGSIRVWRVA